MTPEAMLKPHLSVEALRERYLGCKHLADRTRWHALWLVSQDKVQREVARLLARSHTWVGKLVNVYNVGGPEAVPTHKREGEVRGGKRAALDVEALSQLDHALEHTAPPGGGLWTGAKVAAWIETQTGGRRHRVTGWRYLQKLGYRPQVPRPTHPEAASPEAQAAFQKKSSR